MRRDNTGKNLPAFEGVVAVLAPVLVFSFAIFCGGSERRRL